MIRLIHITPELPPTVGGIADYTAILSQRLVEVSDAAVEPVLVRAGWKEERAPETDFETVDLGGQCSPRALADAIQAFAAEGKCPTVVLLEYSGYGYAPRGAPLWLLQALQQACGEEGVPLITMFHELYATGPPWSSAFWLSPVQRYVAAQLARLSKAVVTNRAESATWLRRYAPSETPVRVQPVFSNIGEPDQVPSWAARRRYAVIFGGNRKKKRLYRALEKIEDDLLQHAGVELIVDIGSSDKSIPSLQRCPVKYVGIQPGNRISDTLKQARVGLLHYPTDFLTKSGIWSGYAAHGVPALIFSDEHPTDSVRDRLHYLRVGKNTKPFSEQILKTIGVKSRKWYQDRAHSRFTASTFLRLLHSMLRARAHRK